MEKVARGYGRVLQGTVVSNKMDKTITVLVTRNVKHERYGKIIKKYKKYHAHDEKNSGDIGDGVAIVESKPTSKTKKWRLQEIVNKVLS